MTNQSIEGGPAKKPRLLDLFCCAGGAGKGYADAGFEVVGVDIDPQPNYPFEFHQANAIEFVREHGHEFDAIHASPPCFIAGTPVLTRRGSVPIEEVAVGDEVWTHANRWRRVTDTMTREADLVRVGPVVTTPDHPFYAATQVRHYAGRDAKPQYPWRVGEPEWVEASKTQGKFLASPFNFEDEGAQFEVTPWLAGRYVADGWTGRDGLMIAVGAGKEAEFERRSGISGWSVSATGKSCSRYTAPARHEAVWLDREFGHGAANKTIPAWLLGASENSRHEFLEGYLSGDGTRTSSGWRANTVSANLASQLRLLALSLGYTSQITLQETPDAAEIEGRVVNQRDYWSVAIVKNDGRYTRNAHGLHWQKHRKPVTLAGRGRVYDITVDEDHSFTAWGYVVHNCQAFSKTKTLHSNEHPDLIKPTRQALVESGKPWVIENVVGAPLIDPIRLTGQHFGMVAPDVDGVPLKLVRARLFESNIPLTVPTTFFRNAHIQTASVYGAGGGWTPRHRDNPERRGGYIPHTSVISELLGIDWMTKHEMSQSIPPVFTEWVGNALINHLKENE